MKQHWLVLTLLCFPVLSMAEFTCPAGTVVSCIESGDRVCAAGTKCVDESATCFDAFPCDTEDGFVCGSEYDAALNDHQRSTEKYDQLVSENVDLRQQRLERKNCVLNATGLAEAQQCVR